MGWISGALYIGLDLHQLWIFGFGLCLIFDSVGLSLELGWIANEDFDWSRVGLQGCDELLVDNIKSSLGL